MKKVTNYNEIKSYLKDSKKLEEILSIHEYSYGCCDRLGPECNGWIISHTIRDAQSVHKTTENAVLTLIYSNGTGIIREPTYFEKR